MSDHSNTTPYTTESSRPQEGCGQPHSRLTRRHLLQAASGLLVAPALAVLPSSLTPGQVAVRRALRAAVALRARLGLTDRNTLAERYAALRAFVSPNVRFVDVNLPPMNGTCFFLRERDRPAVILSNQNLPLAERMKAETGVMGRLLYTDGPTWHELVHAASPAEADQIRAAMEVEDLFGRAFELAFLSGSNGNA